MLRIAQGRVYDPANGIDGEVRDVCLDGGKVVEELPSDAPRLDARGMVVMPGGAVPSTFAPGYRYALLGYTTVVDAAPPPLHARHALAELRDTPIVDAAFLVLMGNNLTLFELIREAAPDGVGRVAEAVAWWLEATGGYGVKLVNPGGVEMWKRAKRTVTSLDDEVEGLGVTPRLVLEAIAAAVDELGLPHPVHVHCNNLGVAGNWRTTLDTLGTLEGRRAHFAHLQFHAYGGTPGKRPRSRAPDLVEHLDAHPEHSADVGQVMFGPAMTVTADAPVSALLREVTGGKWVNADLEAETGCGIVPFAYRERNYVHALQWAIGLELFLLRRDHWRVGLSSEQPNGASFLSYPRLLRLLMDREFRNEQIARANQKAIGRTVLRDRIEREYTLGEIAIITRAGPARLLGLVDKGHLGVGADGDVTVYRDNEDREGMFATPRYVIKGGKLIVEDGELRAAPAGDLLRVAADYDEEIERTLEPLFEERYSVRLANYPVREPWLLEPARRLSARRGG